jgi:DUF1680 family protein
VTGKVADGIPVAVSEETAYPFDESIRFKISFPDKKRKNAFFPFHLRIPGWCTSPVVRLNGEVVDVDAHTGEITHISREWQEGDVLTLELPMQVSVDTWYDGAAVVERGPLVYALKMNENWEKKTFEPSASERYGQWYYFL